MGGGLPRPGGLMNDNHRYDTAEAAKIKARREIRWYLRVLRRIPKFMDKLLVGLTDAITILFLADEMEDEVD